MSDSPTEGHHVHLDRDHPNMGSMTIQNDVEDIQSIIVEESNIFEESEENIIVDVESKLITDEMALLPEGVTIVTGDGTVNDEDANRKRFVSDSEPSFIKHNKEDFTAPRWKEHSKQIFILSNSGRPIFTRYGNENELNTVMSFFLAIVSFIEDDQDKIRTVVAGNLRFVYVLKGSLYLVAVSRTTETASELALQLQYIYEMLIFILTEKIQELLKRRSNFDLRNLLGGTDALLHTLIKNMSHSISFSFRAIEIVPVPKLLRNQISESLAKHRVDKLMYTCLLCSNRVLQICHNKKYSIKVEDLLLLMNFVNSSSSMKTSETWTPVCLPGLSTEQYVYAYIDFLALDMCIVMICSSQMQFFECSAAKQKILEDMIDQNVFEKIIGKLKSPGYSITDVLSPQQIGETGLRHFIYRNNAHSQWSAAQFLAPYQHPKQRKRICRVYKLVRERLKEYCKKSPHKIYFHMTDYEAVIGLMSASFELYACFSLTTSKAVAISVCEQIKRFISREEETIFISSFPSFVEK